jgi:hypothetical protein
LQRIDLTPLDLLEAHIWVSDDFLWSFVSGQYKAAFGFFRDGVRKHAQRASIIYPRHRERCIRILARRMDFWRKLADRFRLPVVTTEGWVSTFYNDVDLAGGGDGWAWFKDLTEAAVELALRKGWVGICSSNFCQPHFRQFWADAQWHRNLTQRIRSAACPVAGD